MYLLDGFKKHLILLITTSYNLLYL